MEGAGQLRGRNRRDPVLQRKKVWFPTSWRRGQSDVEEPTIMVPDKLTPGKTKQLRKAMLIDMFNDACDRLLSYRFYCHHLNTSTHPIRNTCARPRHARTHTSSLLCWTGAVTVEEFATSGAVAAGEFATGGAVAHDRAGVGGDQAEFR